jgi:hypothetical protein
MSYELNFLKSLFLTVFIETTALFLFTRFVYKKSNYTVAIIILAGITSTAATLPYLWFIFPLFLKSKLYYAVFSELFAVVAESFILLGFLKSGYKNALYLSIFCNMVSYTIGLFFHLP